MSRGSTSKKKFFLDSCYLIYLRYAKKDRVAEYTWNLLHRAVKEGTELITNMVVVDEVVWILTTKYRVKLEEVFELLDSTLPLVDVIQLDYVDYDAMKRIMKEHRLRPSDALHISSMKKAGTRCIVSEDEEFDQVPWIKRIWVGREDG
ncbi:MAG: type II toxin-antitoxin system VapC family toxin [Candidatus Bathyarchaeia archaeon]